MGMALIMIFLYIQFKELVMSNGGSLSQTSALWVKSCQKIIEVPKVVVRRYTNARYLFRAKRYMEHSDTLTLGTLVHFRHCWFRLYWVR